MVYITKFASPFAEKKTSERFPGKASQLVKESQTDSGIDLEEHLRKVRAERYILQSIAKEALPKERVVICSRHRIHKDVDVEVWKHTNTQRAFYAGLMVCSSVWNCPVCAAKISERRRAELKQALTAHKAAGGRIAMMTLTFSHKMGDKLIETLEKFTKAIRRFRSGKRYTKVMDKLGQIGSIRAFEITYGQNGWHPHVHILLFYEKEVLMPLIEMELFTLWQAACDANNLVTQSKYGLTVQDGGAADEYMSKWGIDQEMTKSHVKKGREDGLTPFDFLRKYMEAEDEKYLYLFAEYASALKGKSQLFWSRGLKEKFLIEEKSDEELATEKTELADLLGTLKYYEWKKILYAENRVRFLELCEQLEFEAALKIILETPNKKIVTEESNLSTSPKKQKL